MNEGMTGEIEVTQLEPLDEKSKRKVYHWRRQAGCSVCQKRRVLEANIKSTENKYPNLQEN